MKLYPLLLISLLFPLLAAAHSVETGKPLPPVFIANEGELVMQHEMLGYQRWSSQSLTGKVRMVIHVAGRLSAKEQNAPLIAAVQQANFPRSRFQTTTIVNTDDAIPGSAIFVERSIKSSKRDAPWQHFVIDSSGVARNSWQLTPHGSAVMLLDAQGVVRFARDGALTPQEVRQAIALLNQLLSTAAAPSDPALSS
ncbi:YtfJ family protein [Pantoea tagorei]|mgnify:CR=1 FL=1|uniref:YtfJ family protein n=1 Tax=Pantoea TaxID=53335 RepID=UPI000CDDB438|nr:MULTISPECIES: YtfJ family protein [Pantoea]MCG7368414.1 YtfJ family protein [Pantoea sp. ACRSH]MCG7398795.1 YtfJ family protein [Pantoea sp. ACRSC]POW55328.1 YtfJ family protein [Pantoea alvi]UBN52486.1 YtfJ family protein [Pantoea agglomerans]